MSGYFITFEGIEGGGKSTQIKILQNYLTSRGIATIATREPGGTFIGDELRDILLDVHNKDLDYRVEALLYAASRAQLISKIINPALSEDKVVLSDRYIDSSLAYQGYGRGLPIDVITNFNFWATLGLTPSLTFLFKLPAEIGLGRTKPEQADRIESECIEFHKRVEHGYDELAKVHRDRYHVLDATKDIDEISNEIISVIDKKLSITDDV